ncbi:hypothetical protein E8F11_20165 [Pseudomonas sp. BN417]|uniref:hypothetical protein n=1 Tax=Pseudomonas sp. BN417 TaxID=2567890 RepID=UPI0024583ECD|nr:hypothetical protein [Pseudomonas sp. BN417]MDH4557462.1 hypothetical protein [Pseudomonas sp. BN417]
MLYLSVLPLIRRMRLFLLPGHLQVPLEHRQGVAGEVLDIRVAGLDGAAEEGQASSLVFTWFRANGPPG